MNFLKKLFAGGGGSSGGNFFTVYVRPKRCDEIVIVRIHLYNELSQTDSGGYFTRKLARGSRCPFAAELSLHFDGKRRLVESQVENGELVSAEDYETWLAEKTAQSGW
jgi:hypothetical protein